MENHIGHNIKLLSEEKKLKPQEIAYRWKKSVQAVYDLFRNQNPKADAVIEISKILKVPVAEILGIEESENYQASENGKSDDSLVAELKNQLKVKDEQIRFLQGLIEKQSE